MFPGLESLCTDYHGLENWEELGRCNFTSDIQVSIFQLHSKIIVLFPFESLLVLDYYS